MPDVIDYTDLLVHTDDPEALRAMLREVSYVRTFAAVVANTWDPDARTITVRVFGDSEAIRAAVVALGAVVLSTTGLL